MSLLELLRLQLPASLLLEPTATTAPLLAKIAFSSRCKSGQPSATLMTLLSAFISLSHSLVISLYLRFFLLLILSLYVFIFREMATVEALVPEHIHIYIITQLIPNFSIISLRNLGNCI